MTLKMIIFPAQYKAEFPIKSTITTNNINASTTRFESNVCTIFLHKIKWIEISWPHSRLKPRKGPPKVNKK